jgi:hypothetical protein
MNRTKMQAISENKRSAMLIDTANNRAGMTVLKYDTRRRFGIASHQLQCGHKCARSFY